MRRNHFASLVAVLVAAVLITAGCSGAAAPSSIEPLLSSPADGSSGVGVLIGPGLEAAPAGWYGYLDDPALDWDTAMSVAATYLGGGKSDWHLPTKDELDLIARNQDAVGGLTSGAYYWSSTPGYTDSDSAMWIEYFPSGEWVRGGAKSDAYGVRPVRSF